MVLLLYTFMVETMFYDRLYGYIHVLDLAKSTISGIHVYRCGD